MKHFLVWGAYRSGNLGDDLIGNALLSLLTTDASTASAIYRAPPKSRLDASANSESFMGFTSIGNDLARLIAEASALVIGGGEQLSPSRSRLPNRGMFGDLMSVVRLASLAEKPVFVFSLGGSSSNFNWMTDRATRNFFQASSLFSVRDETTRRNVSRSLRGEPASIPIVPDPVLALPSEPLLGNHNSNTSQTITFFPGFDAKRNLSAPSLHTWIQLIDSAHSRNVFVRLAASSLAAGQDSLLTRELHSQRPETEILSPTSSDDLVRLFMEEATAVVSSRLHPLILAVVSGRPALAISSHPKIVDFCDRYGISRIDALSTITREQAEAALTTATAEFPSRAVRLQQDRQKILDFAHHINDLV